VPYPVSDTIEFQILQHHRGSQQQCCGVGDIFTGDIECASVNSLKDSPVVTNIGTWSQAKPTIELLQDTDCSVHYVWTNTMPRQHSHYRHIR
jgi:hypothetical protein